MRRRPAPFCRSWLPRFVAVALACIGAGSVWAQAGSPYTPTPGRGAGVGDNMAQVVLWCGVLLVTAIVLAVAFFLLRKHLSSMDDDAPAAINPLGFTLSDLRQMHASGQLSDTEFELAKRKMMARAKAQLDPAAEDADGEIEFEDLGDLTEASGQTSAADPDASAVADSPDKETTDPDEGSSGSADKNPDADDPPHPPADPSGPPKPPKHW